ncbi:NUDIX domain-containing protein [Nocardia sp. NPDC127526]|uniref:NUDIX hydrolase n=1 Tax=Nocardia sp. NPDC127526 TaxID=3345393 RepID=UPI0036446273
MSSKNTDREPVFVTVDLVALTVRDEALQVLVIERGKAPFQGAWALPGGHLENETLRAAAARELEEETGLSVDLAHLEELGAYGDPGRDPRGRYVTIAYVAFVPDPAELVAGDDARAARWVPVAGILDGHEQLAFDHARIVADGVERARARLETTALAAAFVGPQFTLAELRRVYEIVWGAPLDQRNFHRKISGTPGLVVPTGEQVTTTRGGRPAELYRRGPATTLNPPILRPAPHQEEDTAVAADDLHPIRLELTRTQFGVAKAAVIVVPSDPSPTLGRDVTERDTGEVLGHIVARGSQVEAYLGYADRPRSLGPYTTAEEAARAVVEAWDYALQHGDRGRHHAD